MRGLSIMNCRIGIRGVLKFIVLCACVVDGEALPSTPGVTIHADYRTGSTVGIVCFEYTVSNPATNSASIGKVAIDISKTAGMADVSRDGITDGNGATTELNNFVLQNGKANPKIAVGLSAPAGWEASLSVYGTAVWLPINDDITPGSLL